MYADFFHEILMKINEQTAFRAKYSGLPLSLFAAFPANFDAELSMICSTKLFAKGSEVSAELFA